MNISISPVGSLYVSGGVVNRRWSNQVDVIDVRGGETNRGPPMRHPRRLHATTASATSLFIFGGVDDSDQNSCETFNAQTRQ